MIINDPKPVFVSVEKTEKLVESQGYAYNESGQSYNGVGVEYGGLYLNESSGPILTISDYKPF